MKVKELVWPGTCTNQFEAMLHFCQNLPGLAPATLEPGLAAMDLTWQIAVLPTFRTAGDFADQWIII
jgi:hypothetical protein